MFNRFLTFIIFCLLPFTASADFSKLMTKLETGGLLQIIVTFKTEAKGNETDDLLVQINADTIKTALQSLPNGSYKIIHEFELSATVVLQVTSVAVDALEQSGLVESIEEDVLMKLPDVETEEMIYSLPTAIGEEAAWKSGYTGKGFYIAVIDTGVRKTHQAFAGKDIVEACFSVAGHCPNASTTMTGAGAAETYSSRYPEYGHGTHVAGIALGNATGVAKDADLIAIQIFSKFDSDSRCGGKDCLLAYTSDQTAALEHVYKLRNDYNIAAVNMSFGSECGYIPSALRSIITRLTDAGIAVVAAAGNDNKADNCEAVDLPGCIPEAIAVGAVDSKSHRLLLSKYKQGVLDLYAPGAFIRSAGADSDNGVLVQTGTSMAVPHVAGAFAVLMEKDPIASVFEIEELLKKTGNTVATTCTVNDNEKAVNLAAAINKDVTSGKGGGGGGGGGCSASEKGGIPFVLFSVITYLIFNLRRKAKA